MHTLLLDDGDNCVSHGLNIERFGCDALFALWVGVRSLGMPINGRASVMARYVVRHPSQGLIDKVSSSMRRHDQGKELPIPLIDSEKSPLIISSEVEQ
jgi:hypothetical protein